MSKSGEPPLPTRFAACSSTHERSVVMPWLTRLLNLFRRDRLAQEIADEMDAHIEEALASGRDPQEVRRRLGSSLRHRERSRDSKLLPWLDALASDVVFGWRQLRKQPTATAAAVLSPALPIGATTSPFPLLTPP